VATVSENETIHGELVSNQIEAPIRFSVTDEAIRALKKKLTGLVADTPDGYKRVQAGIAETRMLRGQIETTRKTLKEKALTYGRLVDGEAERITTLLEDIEKPLKLLKNEVDQAKEREKQRLADEKRAKLQSRLEQLSKWGCMLDSLTVEAMTDDAFTTCVHDAYVAHQERARLAKEAAEAKAEADRIERENIAAERAELAKLRAEQLKRDQAADEERKQRAAEQCKIDERNRIDREAIEVERRKLQAERDEQAKIESAKIESAKRKAELDERIAARRAEEQAMRPDVEKLRQFAESLRLIAYPVMATDAGTLRMDLAKESIEDVADYCEDFGA